MRRYLGLPRRGEARHSGQGYRTGTVRTTPYCRSLLDRALLAGDRVGLDPKQGYIGTLPVRDLVGRRNRPNLLQVSQVPWSTHGESGDQPGRQGVFRFTRAVLCGIPIPFHKGPILALLIAPAADKLVNHPFAPAQRVGDRFVNSCPFSGGCREPARGSQCLSCLSRRQAGRSETARLCPIPVGGVPVQTGDWVSWRDGRVTLWPFDGKVSVSDGGGRIRSALIRSGSPSTSRIIVEMLYGSAVFQSSFVRYLPSRVCSPGVLTSSRSSHIPP